MKKMIKGTVFVCCLAVAACGSDDPANNGTTNNGTTNNGTTPNNGTTSNNGTTPKNNGTTNNGVTGGFQVDVDGDCTILDTCIDSFCATQPDDVCDGVCFAFLDTGDDCAGGEGVCDWTTDACDFAGTGVCVAQVTKDAACFAGQCAAGLYCEKADPVDAMGSCADAIAVGMPCPASLGCDVGHFCDGATNPAAPVCVAFLALGADCSDPNQTCNFPNVCDAVTKKCTAVTCS